MGRIATIAGGVRSGKSAFALRWADARGPRRVFVATAQALDVEMQDRVDRHQRQRGSLYRTIEAPFELEAAIAALCDTDVVVIDCLTFWISNLLLADFSEHQIAARADRLAVVLRAASFASIVVSNEVGMGVVPDNALARRFRDATGRAHQSLAVASDELYFATMGTVMRLRPAPVDVVYP